MHMFGQCGEKCFFGCNSWKAFSCKQQCNAVYDFQKNVFSSAASDSPHRPLCPFAISGTIWQHPPPWLEETIDTSGSWKENCFYCKEGLFVLKAVCKMAQSVCLFRSHLIGSPEAAKVQTNRSSRTIPIACLAPAQVMDHPEMASIYVSIVSWTALNLSSWCQTRTIDSWQCPAKKDGNCQWKRKTGVSLCFVPPKKTCCARQTPYNCSVREVQC